MSSQLNENVSKFEEYGYVLIRGFFSKQKAEAAAQWLRDQNLPSMAKTFTDQEPGVELAVWQNIHSGNHPVAAMAGDEKMLQIASQAIGQEVYIWSSKVNLKAAWCGTVEYFHQDYVYWKDRGYKTIDMLSCMTFLDPHNQINGGLNIFPKSHKEGFIPHEPFFNINGLSKFMIPPKKLDEMAKKYEVKVVEADPGDILLFHTGLIHGSSHNISKHPRMVVLSQLNVKTNTPDPAYGNAKAFNLSRASSEVVEAERKLNYFQNKLQNQIASEDVTFNSPIQDFEKNRKV